MNNKQFCIIYKHYSIITELKIIIKLYKNIYLIIKIYQIIFIII